MTSLAHDVTKIYTSLNKSKLDNPHNLIEKKRQPLQPKRKDMVTSFNSMKNLMCYFGEKGSFFRPQREIRSV
jgi:hypothetical protein